MSKKQIQTKASFVECSLFSYVDSPKELEFYLKGITGKNGKKFSEHISFYNKIVSNSQPSSFTKKGETLRLLLKKNEESTTIQFYGFGQVKNKK
jgi:hypothetical protein